MQRPGIASPLLWSTISSLGTQMLSFVTFAVLARLLGAETFGLVALAALVIDLMLVVSGAGINEAVVQRATLDEVDADTAFWINLGSGLIVCLAAIVTAPWIAALFGYPELGTIIVALAAIFAITPLGAVHTARLTRDLKFRSIATRDIAASLAGAAVGLPLALSGFGAWALVAQRIAAALAMVLAVWTTYRWIPKLRFRRRTCAELLRFGSYMGLSRMLNQINIRSAELISGALVGPIAVAFIRAGSRIMEVLNQITYTPFQQVAMPILTQARHDTGALRDTYLRLSRLSSFIMFPAFLGSLAIAPQIVALVFGPGWEPVADAIRIFACAVVASQMNNLIVSVIAAVGQSRTVLSWTTAQVAIGGIAAVAVSPWCWQAMLLTGVARGYLLLPYGFHLLRKHAGIGFGEVVSSLRPAITSSCLMAAMVTAGVTYNPARMSDIESLALWLPVGALIYFGAFLYQDRAIIGQVLTMVQARKGRVAATSNGVG